MRTTLSCLGVLLVVSGCGADASLTEFVSDDAAEATALRRPLAESRCTGAPRTSGKGRWRHFSSHFVSLLGSNHRGVDLVAPSSAARHTLAGDISYGSNDKALEDELVEVFACLDGQWSLLGQALTDAEGHFSLPLTGSARLPIGLRDLFVSVVGDRTSARFVGIVVGSAGKLVVTDIDGTLTDHESAFTEAIVSHTPVAVHPGAAAALETLRAHGYAIVYLSARGRYFSSDTRAWLNAKGLPSGAMHLAPSFFTTPGADTVAYKTEAMKSFGLPVALGVGNRQSDVDAYLEAAVPHGRIFVKLPEYQGELADSIASGLAIGFDDYSAVQPIFDTF